jgi:hypothetical protein
MKKLLCLTLLTWLTGCGQSSPSAPEASATVQPAAKSAPKVVTGEERKPIVAALTKGMDQNRDKMEGVTFYSPKGLQRTTSSFEAYVALPDKELPTLRMRSTYLGERWIFYSQIKVMADDKIVYEREFKSQSIKRDNSGRQVWEVSDIPVEAQELAALKAIAGAKAATIRFTGRNRRDDHEINARERANLQRSIVTYEKMTAQLQRPPA